MTRTASADTPVKSAALAPGGLHEGNPVWVVGLSADGQPHTRATQIAGVDPLALPLSRSMRFRDTNLDVAQLVNPPLDYDGVLSNEAGQVWACGPAMRVDNGRELSQENRGVPIDVVATMLEHIHADTPLHCLETELVPLQLADARQLGLSDEWLKKLELHRRQRAPGADGGAAGGRLTMPRACCSRATSCSPSTAGP